MLLAITEKTQQPAHSGGLRNKDRLAHQVLASGLLAVQGLEKLARHVKDDAQGLQTLFACVMPGFICRST